MRAIQLQQSLWVSGGEFVGRVHEKAPDQRIYLAQKQTNMEPGSNPWWQRGHSLKAAIAQADAWETMEAADCYTSVNGFNWQQGGGRKVSDAEAINGFYVDFDVYAIPELTSLSADDFFSKVLSENPWLPPPTLSEYSGNGFWMFWMFDRPLLLNKKTEKHNFLAQWQTCQDYLIKKLTPYGADVRCADVARVVRLPSTINTKTNRKAKAWETSDRYKFADLKQAINAEFRRENPRQDCVPIEPRRKQQQSSAKPGERTARVSALFNLYTLAHARMNDYKALAQLRGGRLAEHRRMAIWLYSVAAAQFCKTEESLRGEVESFINECVQEPDKYLKAVNYESTVERFRNESLLIATGVPRNKAREQLGRDKSCYTLTNKYIIGQLDITEAEQRDLKTIIGQDEKRRRHCLAERKKRRAAGAKPRQEYLATSSQRREQAQQMYKEGLSVRGIAEKMGLSVGAVHRYVSSQ